MRKVLNVITLIVMLGVNIMNPFTYAISSGDDFEEIQNVDEAMQEDGDFSDEENIENSENEEDSENVENNEDLEEQEEENTENDEISNEEYEGDNEKDEEIEKENKEEQEENIDKTENTTENQDEENIDKIEEDSGEQENSEKQTENNGSAIDLLKDVVEGSGNILTGEIETLSGDIVEFTGEVEELTGKILELSLARETLNIDPIIGTENTKGVTVNVEAQPGTFPQGTELRIKPITLKKELNEIKDQISDKDENISEESLVAFDITFIYVLSGGEEVEVQPKNVDGVKVVFNYENNENLSEADVNDEQEIKVFHIDDKDENGEKVAQGEEIVKDVTNRVESEEVGIVVADAESFSIYAIVTTEENVSSVRVTHNLRGGYWMEDHSMASKTIEYTCSNGSCETTMHYRTPSKTGYMFIGWYDETLTNRRKDGVATDGMTVYAKWQDFNDLNVYVLKDDEHKYQYTLMDRNMGATGIYTNSLTINPESMGYYYQWGNNYGFDSYSDNAGAIPTSQRSSSPIDVSNFSWDTPYYNSKFVIGKHWLNSLNKKLWGDHDIKTYESKQGPCPEGYHVPSKDDWQNLLTGWKSVNSRANINFYYDFLIPSAGYRSRNDSKITDSGKYRYYTSSWASQDMNNKSIYAFSSNSKDILPAVSNSTNTDPTHERSANGLSVRCFKNITDSTINVSNIDLNGGTGGILSIASGEVVSLQEPKKGDLKFGGFYANEDYLGEKIIKVGDVIPEGTTHLYAKRDCPEGQVEDQGVCVSGFKIEFDATTNGGTTTVEDIVITGGVVSKTINLADYTAEKEGYYFVGWNTDPGAGIGLQGQQTFTQNTVLYAIFLKLYTYTFLDEEGEVISTGYYQSGVSMDMSKLIPFDYYINGGGDISSYDDILTLGLSDPTKGWKWTPEPPSDGIATGDLILQGELFNKYSVTFLDADDNTFLAYDVLDGTIISEPNNHPEKAGGYSFVGWYEDAERTTRFDFSNGITGNTIIYPDFNEVLCEFKSTSINSNTQYKIDGFSGTQTEDCLTHFVIPREINGKPVVQIGGWAFDGSKSNAQIISGEISLPDTITSIGEKAFYKNNITGNLRLPINLITISKDAFNDNQIGGELIIPDSVTIINGSVFYNNQLTGVVIGNSVTSIGGSAFKNNQIGGELIIPDSVTIINGSAFENNQLTGVVIGNSVTSIGEKAFFKNNITGNLRLPSSLITISKEAFSSNQIGGELIIPDSVTIIDSSAFYGNQITGLELGNSVQTIGSTAFSNNKLEGELIIPNSVTSIGASAFDGNNGGNKISGKLVIPNSVTSIGNSAFRKNQITGLELGNSVVTIGNNAFENNQITGLELGNSVVTIGNSAFYSNKITGKLEIPDSVITIGDSAFMNNQITGLELGNSVVTIGDSAFENNQLTGYLEIPDSVITIKIDAFRSNQLSGVTIGNSVTKIDNYAFYNNKLTGKLEIPDSVITIGNYAFCDPDNYGVGQGNELTEVVIGNGVISIGVGAFFNNQITGLVLGSSVENIQDTAFRRNKIEGELIIPDSVKFIGSYAFGNNMISGVSGTLLFPGNINTGVMNSAFRENLIENLIIGTGITYIADQSFGQSDTRNLIDGKHIIKTVFFPETLTGIGNYAFNVQEIEELNLPNSLETIGKQAFDKTQISGTLVLPDNLVSIDEYAFSNQHISGTYCVSNEVRNSNLSVCTLKSVILNDNLQSIGTGVFAANDIKSVYIPDSVTYLAYRAFDQGGTRGHIYLTGYVTTKKPELDYTGAYVKPLYQLYTYTFKDELGNTVGTGYYPEILESNTTKVIPLNYYNGIGNVEDFTGVDSLIPHGAGEVVTWSEPLSEHTIVTGNLIVTGSTSALHSVTFKNPFTGDIVEYIPNNQYVSEPEEFVVQGYTFTGWYSGDVKVEFPLQVTSDLILTGRYDTNKYTLSFYSDKGKSELLSGIVYDYNTTINTQPIVNPTKTNYDFAGWKNVTGDADVVFPLTITGDLDIYANWEDPTKEWIGWDGCYQYRTYTGEVNDTIEYYAEITAYSGAASCPRENLTMPNVITRNDRNYTIKSIGGGAFSAKYLSGTITLPNSLETIGGASFYNNPNITSVIISEGVTSIGDEAFRYNSGLTGIVLPSTLTTIGYSAFESAGLESVIIPDSVVEIKSSAFSYNTHLKSVKIGDGLTTLNSAVFQYCNELETVELGDGLETIRSAFAFDTKLKNIIWGNNVKNIYGGAFYDTAIEEVILPDSVTFIDGGAFGLNSKLKTIKLGTGLITLNGGVFNNSTGIENIDLGNVETIRVGNFENTQITGLVIPDTVTYIEGGAFGSNSKLKTVKIGTGLKILNYGVFNNSTGIENVDLGKLETINPNNFSGTQITGLVIPDTVTYIGDYAFINNTKLQTLTLGTGLIKIGSQAFANSALTGVSLPNSLTTLGNSTFCADDGTNTGTVIGFIGDNPTTSTETLEAQDDTACFVIKKSTYNISTGSNDETQGSVSVYGEPRYGKRIEFRANVHDTSLYKFVKWELNGKDVMTGDNQFWTGDLVIENLTGDLIVTGHFAAYSGCSWSGGEIAHGTSVTGYLTPTVSYGETCVSEIRTCNDGTLSGTYEYASCTPEGASSCDLPWGGTVPDGTSVTGYKTSSEKCPDECESVIAICNNGNWNVENFTGIYTEPNCVTQPVSTEGYDLDECPEHGICSSITGYTVSENICIKGDEKFKLDGCDAHYHTGSDNKSCEIDKFDIVWNYRDKNGTRTGETIKIEYGKNPTEPTLPEISQTAQTGYTFSGWTPEVSSPVTTGAEYTAQYNETTREYLITFLDGDGEIIQTGMVAYGVKPSYTGETPTKTATAQYSYSFNNTWEPEIIPVTTGAEYTAQFDSILNKYTVTINVNTNSGSVSTGSVTENWGSLITESENELTIGDTTVIATAKTGDAQYTHEFSRWNNTCGNKIETGCSIEAEFTSTIREYTITFHSNGGSVVTGQTKQYGSHVDEPADPTRQGYGFSGWYSNISLTQKYNFTETVTGDLYLYAKWTPITYTIGYELNSGNLPEGQKNPTTYTIESNDITLKNPTRIGYIFSGWTGTDLSTESTEVTIASGSMGDRVYYANWQPDNVNVTVYYFTQKLNPSTNELIDEFDTHDIRIVQMQSDLEFNIYNEFYKPIEGFEYVRATVTEQDTSEHTETTTTVLPNGSRVINLYYTRGQYNFAIIPVDNVTTQGSSENSGYYYGATITLSGSSSNDCFMWSGWTNLPEGTINNSQTSFTMPANAISLSGVVTEKTYNISFNGNGADEGEMETLNGIACTQSIYLPINKFKKVGHTFTGWTTTIDGSKEYNDGARIQALTTGNNITVNLIAVWDINKYDIVWKNYNGETLDSQILEYGVIPEYGGEYPLRDPDIQFSYSFSGWTPEIQRVEGPQVYTAVYSTTLNEYTITWDVDGTITTETYEYGAIPYFSGSKGKVPDKQYIYTFSGWNPQISPVSGNITYTATYTATLRKYTVTWINSNGDVLETDENVPYGTTPTYDGPTPTKEGDTEHHYTFAGWAPAVGPISGDTTYEAIFDSTKKEYTIIWQNENGGILETDEDVPYGTMPSYDGPTPTKASDAQYSYEFAGWTPETGAVVGHQTYTATYTAIPRKYTVTWKNSNGSVIRTDTGVEYGTTLEYQGPTPTSGGNAQYSYEFTGWNPAIGEIHGDTTYTAVYTHKTNKYTITWKNRDGTVIKTVTGVEYGATPIYGDVSPTKTGDAQYSYEFIGWEPGISTVTGDTSYTAKFKENLNRYKVIFINDDSGILKEATEYDYGTSRNDIEKPTDPTKASDVQYSYEFAGWEPSISVLTGDITFKATYTSTVNKYTVTWKNRNGSIIKTNTGVEYGTEPEYDGPTPTKESTSEYSYRFTGWEPAIGEIHGDTTYTAQFEPILESYTITWKDRDGKVLKVDENVPYGVTPVYSGDNPSRSGNIQYDYIFDGWTPSLVPVHGDATYTAKYRSELKKYKVIWKNWDDEVLETDENVLYGSTPKYDGEEPTKPGSPQYSYVFDRWTPNIHAVDGDVVYKAVFEELINKYTVTWENWDESVIKTDTGVEYGTVLEYDGPTPTKEGDAQYSYEFSGWDNEIKAIHEDTTYRATYIQSVNEYLITFLDGDGKIIQTGMVAYGATPNYTGLTPTKAKTQEYTYTFNNTWSPEIHSVGGEETYTAQFNSTKNKYTITINANTNSGSINTGLITAEYGTSITESGNELKIGDTTIIATAKPSDAQYTHEFSGWNNTCGLTLNDGCIIEAEFRSIIHKYTVIWNNEDGMQLEKDENVPYGSAPSYDGVTPVKPGDDSGNYMFNGWNPTPINVIGDAVYTAKYKEKETPQEDKGNRRSGGGGRKYTTSEEMDQHGSAEDIDKPIDSEKEVFDAYKRAYKYGITTIDNEQKADPNGYVTRGHLAKMVVNFTVNVLGRDMPVDTPTKCKRNDDDSEWKSSEIKFYAEKSCALGVMGLYTKKFMPNKIVDRAEFGTVVSRLLWGDKYNELDTPHHLYFTKHLKALHENGIMKDIDNPLGRKEFRKRVWLVLKRIELEKNMK